MKRRVAGAIHALSIVGILAGPVVPTQNSSAADWPFLRPKSSVERVAKQIDDLEKHIDEYGSIVAKHPDIWGESRLMQHRDEYERQMAEELEKFKPTLNAQVRLSDQGYLATATLIDAALTTGTTREANSSLQTLVGDVNNSIDVKRSDATAAPSYASFKLGEDSTDTVGLEPTAYLDQKSRYLNHLHELRRINEGDDIADAPGYSIDLVRVPVSVLPGKKTSEGYGGEITLSITPRLGQEALPVTFRRWVTNDILVQYTPVLTWVLNNPDIRSKEQRKILEVLVDALDQSNQEWNELDWSRLTCDLEPMPASGAGLAPSPDPAFRDVSQETESEPRTVFDDVQEYLNSEDGSKVFTTLLDRSGLKSIAYSFEDQLSRWKAQFTDVVTQYTVSSISRRRNGQLPFPQYQLSEVFGQGLLLRTAWEAYTRIGRTDTRPARFNHFHYHDVEAYLKDQVDAAYEMLLLESNSALWDSATLELATAIRNRDVCAIENIRWEFMNQLKSAGRRSTLAPYSWAIIVESALLNERLIRDMNEVADTKGCSCRVHPGTPLCHPGVAPQFADAFNNYVQCRWPVYAFALDPINQEQNVGNSFSRRREFQLALAVGLASGQIRGDQVTRFARRLELDMATLDQNRTIVAFSHGDDTVGWRFYPRVQVPPVESNLTVAVRDLLIGGPGRKDEQRVQQLQPGIRECTALVVRPSFLSDMNFDTRTNWFRLSNPKKTELDLTDTVRLSRSVRSIQDAFACLDDEHLYRNGESYRLHRRVQQLSDELPLQSLTSAVPVENALGGFQMFAPGATGLAPHLYAWYGQPGINNDEDATTTLFLAGENFSVRGTRVLAGGQPLNGAGSDAAGNEAGSTRVELLSRRLLRVTVPGNIQTMTGQDAEGNKVDYAEIRVATQYGVTEPAYIPVAGTLEAPAAEGVEPVLADWFGRPGLNPEASTSLFLEGENFSDDGTHVIAGGTVLSSSGDQPGVDVLSSKVLRVTIPAEAQTVSGKDGAGNELSKVSIQVATSHGISAALKIPVSGSVKTAPEQPKPPTLTKKYGPDIDLGAETNVFLSGTNFSGDDIRVMAGGQILNSDQIEVLNSSLLRVSIPAGVKSTETDGALRIEIRVATGDGLSGPLYVPAIAAKPKKKTAAKASAAGSFGWAKSSKALTVQIEYDNAAVAELAFTQLTAAETVSLSNKLAKEVPLSGLAQKDADGNPVPVLTQPAHVAFWLHMYNDENGTSTKKAVGPVEYRFGARQPLSVLEPLVRAAVQSEIERDFGLTRLELEGYVRFPADNLPVTRIDDVLEFDVTEVKKLTVPTDDADAASSDSASIDAGGTVRRVTSRSTKRATR